MTQVSWIYFQIGRPTRTCVTACVSAKNFVCLKTALLVFKLDLLPPRYLSADNDNEVRLLKHLHIQTLPKDGRFWKGKKSSKQIVTTIVET